MAKMEDGSVIEGECEITLSNKKIKKIFYKEEPQITPEAINALKEADLIILSMGSIYTSIIPNLINNKVLKAIDESNAKIMYVSNMMTQPGETDGFTISDHVKLLNSYLGKRKLDIVIVNNKKIDTKILEKYQNEEQKDQVMIDYKNLKNIKIIEDNYFLLENGMARHDSLKLALSIFTELLS